MQISDVIPQAAPLFEGELIGADQADADALAVEPLRMRAHFIQVPADRDRTVGVNHEVIADCSKLRSLPLTEFTGTLETSILMPLIDIASREPFAIRRGRAVDDDAFDVSSHTAQYRANAGRGILKGFMLCAWQKKTSISSNCSFDLKQNI